VNTLTLISGQWIGSRLRFPLLLLLPLLLFGGTLLRGRAFLPQAPATLEPLASESPERARAASEDANLVASDRLFPLLSDELAMREELAAGRLPLWNPRAGLGAPLAAGSMAAPWNPLRWPFLLLDPALASGWHALLSLVLAGLGMMMFLEGRGLKYTAAMFGALAFQSSGFLVANLHYLPKVDAALWAPWCLWGVDLLYRGRRNAGLIVVFGLGMSALAGFPPVFLFVAALTLAWILKRALEAIRKPLESREWKRSLIASLLFAGLGAAVGGVHLVPMAEASRGSTRRPQEPERIQAQSLPSAALLSTVLPTAFGEPSDPRPAPHDAATWWWLGEEDLERGLAANRIEWHLYVGATVLALAVAGFCAKTRRALFPALVVLGTAGFLFGWPLADALYGLPGANLGAPARAAPLAMVGLAWLAALGFDALLEGQRPARLGAMAGAALLFLLGLALWTSIEPEPWAKELEAELTRRYAVDAATVRGFFTPEQAARSAERLLGGAKGLLGIATLIGLLALYAGRLTVRGSGLLGCALLVFEGSLAGLPQARVPDVGPGKLFPRSEAMDSIAHATGDGRLLRFDGSASGVDDLLQLARPNLPQLYGAADLTPYQALPDAHLAELWRGLDPAGLYRDAPARLADPALLDAPLLDLLRVSCVLSRAPIEHPRLALRHTAPGLFVYARSGALPPARVVPRLVADGGDAPGRLTDDEHDPLVAALHGEARGGPAGEAFGPGELRFARPAPGRIEVELEDSGGGWLVAHEAWAPGWRASVNGEERELLRLDHVYMGVEVPAGDARVRFEYRPRSLHLGALLSLLGVLSALACTRLRHLRQRRRELLRHARPESR